MSTAKVFKHGHSQAVRLPKAFRFDTNHVVIRKIGSVVVLYPADSGWAPLLNASGRFTADFMSERRQPKTADKRKPL